MQLTWLDAKTLLARYAAQGGKCVDDPEVHDFTYKVLQFMLYSGAAQELRRFDFVASQGVFTVPDEVESIIKLKVNGQVGNVWDKWFAYHQTNYLNARDEDCICPPSPALFEDPNYYPTAYDMQCGLRVGILGHCQEDWDAHAIILGKDQSGREIFTDHKGVKLAGERLTITKGVLNYTQVKFGTITSVILSKTNGYKTLYAVDPVRGTRGFLSDYSPIETHPAYRRYKLVSQNCCPYVNLSLLARIRLKSSYADNDKIPFENLLAIQTAGQAVNSLFNSDGQTATQNIQAMDAVIEREQRHKKVNTGSPLSISGVTGPSRIQNIVGGFRGGLGGFFRGGR